MDGDANAGSRPVRERLRRLVRRVRRFERRELREFGAWLEHTRNLLHLSVLIVVPVVIAAVTVLANAVDAVSFLLYPPLAAGAYTLFSDPAGRFASPVRFVAGLTAGAVCGAVALHLAGAGGGLAIGGDVNPLGAALAVFLTGAATWAFDVEEPAAFSAALLALVTRSGGLQYVVSVALSSVVVVAAFSLWKRGLYEERARYLYRSVRGDDHVLVPMRGPAPEATAALAARLAAAHEAGKVVLLALVDADAVESARRAAKQADRERPDADLSTEAAVKGAESLRTRPIRNSREPSRPASPLALTDGGTTDDRADASSTRTDDGADDPADTDDDAERRAAASLATALEHRAGRIEERFDVPCEVVVAGSGGDEGETALRVAHETNCDLVATPFEADDGTLSPFVGRLFRGDTDVLVHQSDDGRTEWSRILVPVRGAGDGAHAMLDFAARLIGDDADPGSGGVVTLVHCIDAERDRRRAEEMLADLSETVGVRVETAVARRPVEEYLARHASGYDLVIVGASRDRSVASRFVSPPTFRRLDDLDADVAIVDRSVEPWHW